MPTSKEIKVYSGGISLGPDTIKWASLVFAEFQKRKISTATVSISHNFNAKELDRYNLKQFPVVAFFKNGALVKTIVGKHDMTTYIKAIQDIGW